MGKMITVKGVSGVTPGAEINIEDIDDLTFHYVFSIDHGWADRIETELSIFWNRENSKVEYRKPEDIVAFCHLPNITKFIEYWNKMGTIEIPILKDGNWFEQIKNSVKEFLKGQEMKTVNVNIGVVVIITHGMFNDGNMYIDRNEGKDQTSGRQNKTLFQDDIAAGYKKINAFIPVGKGYQEKELLVFGDNEYNKLDVKTIDTLINLSCYSGTFSQKNMMKKLLSRHKVSFALGVDGISELMPQGIRDDGDYTFYNAKDDSNTNYVAKGFVHYPSGKGENEILLNKFRSTSILTFMDWTRGKGDQARTSADIRKP